MDSGRTGRLEVTVFKNSKTDGMVNGVVIHSKASTGKYPSADWENFMKKLDSVIN